MPGIRSTMKEFAEGKLKTSSGDSVTQRKQAIAIGLNEDKRAKNSAAKKSISAAEMKRTAKRSGKDCRSLDCVQPDGSY